MCGIYGIALRQSVVTDTRLEHSQAFLHHRGPDGNGTWTSPCRRVGLAHNRLAVLDLSKAASQPMSSKDGRYQLVFNGEIYNFAEIRSELTDLGMRFLSTGDTEVLLAAYGLWGEDCLSRLNGMYAFAIYDRGGPFEASSLFFARDRAGEKPFYYAHSQYAFEFASEPKALDHSRSIDLHALNHYLSLGYVPSDLAIFDGVKKLPPAHCGRLDLNTGKLNIRRYWKLPHNHAANDLDGEELASQAGALLEDSVRLRLAADVPVGVLLSGGLDSSLVVAAAARVSDRPVETFTIALPGSSLDEAHHAERIAAHFGTRHHVLPVESTSLDLLERLAPFIDEPIADSSILPAWLVFGLARQAVTVALGGDGGDELFGGYSDYTTSLADARRLKWVPQRVLTALGTAAAHLPAGVRGRNRMASLRMGPTQQLIWGRPYFDTHLRRRLFNHEARVELGSAIDAPELFLLKLFKEGCDPVDRMTRTHFGSILPDDFLIKVDRTSMAHSLEVRAPFLDHRLIEFAFSSVPSRWKVHGTESRRLQRTLARRWLPKGFDLNRKQGFSIPINEWLRRETESSLMRRMECLPDVIDRGEVRRLVKGHLGGRANGGRLFALLMLAMAVRNIG